MNKIIIILFCFSLSNPVFGSKKVLIPVRFGVVDSMQSQDMSPCGSYKDSLNAAINYAIEENEKDLTDCGYKLEYILNYFDISDILSARDAGKSLNSKNVWFVIGPRRSDFFLLTASALQNSPIISLMAAAKKITLSKSLMFTMYPDINKLAKAAYILSIKKKMGNDYGVFVDATCSACRDFAEEFNKISKNKLNRKFILDSAGDNPDTFLLKNILINKKINFLLLPNYSKFSGFVISEIHRLYPEIKFMGSDGWGENEFSYLPHYHLPTDTTGYSVRAGQSPQEMADLYGVHSLNREWNGKIIFPATTSYTAIHLVREITSILCSKKPKNKHEFSYIIKNSEKKILQSHLTISAWQILEGKPTYISSVDKMK